MLRVKEAWEWERSGCNCERKVKDRSAPENDGNVLYQCPYPGDHIYFNFGRCFH